MSILHNDRGQHYSQIFTNAVVVDISSTDFVPTYPSQLFIGGTGVDKTLKVDTPESTGITFTGVPVGFFPVLVTKVYKDGTSATNIVALR